DSKELTIWSHLKPGEIKAVEELANKWGEENGYNVKVVDDQGEPQDYIQAANSSKGPDVYFGMAHDNLGTLQKAGLLAEVPEEIIEEEALASEQIVDAITIEGTQYAVPIAQETTALFYNKDLVSEVPETMEELVEIAEEKGFKYAIGDFYRSYGFIAANGGYVFKDNDGTLDSTDIGLNNEGAVKGYEFLEDLVVNKKLMASDINGDAAIGEFTSGNSAFFISGPWDIASFEEQGLNFDVAKIPTLNGNEVTPFMGVQAAFVSSKSDTQEDAWELVKYLAENSGDIVLEEGNRIPVYTDSFETEAFKNNKYMEAFVEQAKVADPMPNIPEVQAMWKPGETNILLMIQGQQTAKEAADKTVEQIKEGIAQQK
ncbi:MAG: maltose ABC transporter substrate-binding protein, partial [Clostridium perfringens]|nr:maltose ABC transporter substrate-binding protein [Clostridium perfringens]